MDDRGLKILRIVFTLFGAVSTVGNALIGVEQHRLDVVHQDKKIEQAVATQLKAALDDSHEFGD